MENFIFCAVILHNTGYFQNKIDAIFVTDALMLLIKIWLPWIFFFYDYQNVTPAVKQYDVLKGRLSE